ncbi:MAG: hypothetical protein ABIW82_01985 [Dokdonella sp.]
MLAHRIVARFCFGAVLLTTAAFAESDYGKDSGQNVHRCVGLHGEIVFSGLSCAASAATGTEFLPAAATAPLPAADSCAASRSELRERMVAAIARHDPNALAGMLRWRGVGGEAAKGRLRTLRDLARRPLLAIDGVADTPADDGDNAVDAADGMHVRTGGGDSGGVHEHAFGIALEGGCYWLLW